MRVRRLSSSSGLNLLNIGAMKSGTSTSISNWNEHQTIHAYSHHRSPDFSIRMMVIQTRPRPSASEMTVLFIRSIKNRRGDMRLKPKRASSTN
ncbi:hypothetical protein D3C81_1869200 [compost metagenome]